MIEGASIFPKLHSLIGTSPQYSRGFVTRRRDAMRDEWRARPPSGLSQRRITRTDSSPVSLRFRRAFTIMRGINDLE